MRIKCKQCGRKFNIKGGSAQLEKAVEICNRTKCPLKKEIKNLPMVVSANDEEVIETYEEIPLEGSIDRKELMKEKK